MNAASAVTNDTVLVSAGTYDEAVNFSNKPVLLTSAGGPGATMINPPTGAYAVTFNGGETSNSILSGFTLTNGGISISFGSPTIASNHIVNCGTAINSRTGCPRIENNTIIGSTGLGIFLYGVNGGIAIVNNNTVIGCANDGIYLEAASSGSSVIQGNTIESNSASGIALYSSGTATIINNWILHNQLDGIHNIYSSPNIVQNLILNNIGSGIYNESSYEMRGPWMINNTILGNGGAGIWMDNFFADDCEIYNNIAIGNPALNLYPLNPSPPYVVKNNDFYSLTGAAYLSSDIGLIGSTPFNLNLTNNGYISSNFSTNPFFACFPSADCHLLAGSPCIQSGSTLAPLFPIKDFDGNIRTPVPNTNNLADIGAYAFNSASPPTPCLYLFSPTNVVATAIAGQNAAVATYPPPDATPTAKVTCVPVSGSVFPAGTNTVLCTLTYGTNTLTSAFTVTVLVPPYITNQPSFISITANGNANIGVGDIGTLPMNYQWSFDGTVIADTTNSALSISNAQAIDEGYYQVTLANDYGAATSGLILVRVVPSAALIVSEPQSFTEPAGNQAVFNASVLGSAPLLLQWYKNGALLAGANLSQLVLSNVQATDAGTYQLLASNSLATVVSTGAVLTVQLARPWFSLQPTSTGCFPGTSVSLTSLAKGSDDGLDPINYAWYFQSNIMSGQTDATLSLASVVPANQGAYYVVATNSFGWATSVVVQLTVYQAPSFPVGLSNELVDAGSNLLLNPDASGTPPLAYSWKLDTTVLSNTTAFLALTNITPSQAGYYSVTVTNQFGSISTTGKISVFLPSSQVVAWGDDSGGQTNVPPDLDDAVAVAGGDYHSVALRHDGTLVAWGSDEDGQTDVPTNSLPFVSIAAGADHNLAIAADGSVVAWGRDDYGQTDIPTTVASALNVAAGDSHSVALLSSGSVVAWGDNTYGQTTLPLVLTGYWWYNWWYEWFYTPPQLALAIAAGYDHSLALMYDGTVVGWGDNTFNQASPPPGLSNVVAIAAGYMHSVALCSNGTVVVWGDNSFGQTNVPVGLSNVLAIAAGDFHTFALRSNGSIVAWGDDTFGQTAVPSTATNAIGMSSGYYHGLARVPFIQVLQPHLTRNGLVLSWNGTGILQWSPFPTGPYTDVPYQGNSWTNANMSGPAKFFRVRH